MHSRVLAASCFVTHGSECTIGVLVTEMLSSSLAWARSWHRVPVGPSFPTLGGLVVPVPIRFYNTLGKGVGTMDGEEWVRVCETLVVDLVGV